MTQVAESHRVVVTDQFNMKKCLDLLEILDAMQLEYCVRRVYNIGLGDPDIEISVQNQKNPVYVTFAEVTSNEKVRLATDGEKLEGIHFDSNNLLVEPQKTTQRRKNLVVHVIYSIEQASQRFKDKNTEIQRLFPWYVAQGIVRYILGIQLDPRFMINIPIPAEENSGEVIKMVNNVISTVGYANDSEKEKELILLDVITGLIVNLPKYKLTE